MALASQLESYESKEQLIEAVKSYIGRLKQGLRQVRDNVSSIAYPFDHVYDDITVGKYAIEIVPTGEELGPLIEMVPESVNKLIKLHSRLADRLASAAETTEKLVGLDPLLEITISMDKGSLIASPKENSTTSPF